MPVYKTLNYSRWLKKTTGYEPLLTLKAVADNIWIVDGPIIRFYGLPFPTRMTVIRLGRGELFIHSPTALSPNLAEAVAVLGDVRHLVSPNWIHYAFIAEWQRRFPEALTWAAPSVRARAESRGLSIRWDRDLGPVPPGDWGGEIEQLVVLGGYHSEVVFFHGASRTLILSDLIQNFELAKAPFWFRPLIQLAGVVDPDGKMPLDIRLSFRPRKTELKDAVCRMIEWEPERVILAHGRWYERNAVAELKRAFRWLGV